MTDVIPGFGGGDSPQVEDFFGPGFEEKPDDPPQSPKKEKDKEIRPSQVYETMEIIQEGILEFYDSGRRFLGKRPLEQREDIYNHIRKTKEISKIETDPDEGRIYVFWKNRSGEED